MLRNEIKENTIQKNGFIVSSMRLTLSELCFPQTLVWQEYSQSQDGSRRISIQPTPAAQYSKELPIGISLFGQPSACSRPVLHCLCLAASCSKIECCLQFGIP